MKLVQYPFNTPKFPVSIIFPSAWAVWNIWIMTQLWLSIQLEFLSSQLTHFFQRGRSTTNQPSLALGSQHPGASAVSKVLSLKAEPPVRRRVKRAPGTATCGPLRTSPPLGFEAFWTLKPHCYDGYISYIKLYPWNSGETEALVWDPADNNWLVFG